MTAATTTIRTEKIKVKKKTKIVRKEEEVTIVTTTTTTTPPIVTFFAIMEAITKEVKQLETPYRGPHQENGMISSMNLNCPLFFIILYYSAFPETLIHSICKDIKNSFGLGTTTSTTTTTTTTTKTTITTTTKVTTHNDFETTETITTTEMTTVGLPDKEINDTHAQSSDDVEPLLPCTVTNKRRRR
ncbi:MAG: hypothetical protein ACTSUE_05675 [Promethearchaeota archaeon]